MASGIELAFPGLCGTGYQVTSPRDEIYNCIAWAAGDSTKWWWPDLRGNPDSSHWPAGVPRLETVEAFREAFATLGYMVCQGEFTCYPDYVRMWPAAKMLFHR
jgi:hypothetical protein